MKYKKEIFDLSQRAYEEMNTTTTCDDDTHRKQLATLRLILRKFQEELIKRPNTNGIIRAKFESRFYSDFNDGYNEINDLVKTNNFDSFASECCMYIGEVETTCDEYHTAYYEIIWDYKTYYEVLNSQKSKTIEDTFCKTFGHDYGAWNEIKWNDSEGEHTKWNRKCNNCGFVELTDIKPKELIIAEVEAKIASLKREINRLK